MRQSQYIYKIQILNHPYDRGNLNYYKGEVDPKWLVMSNQLLFAWAGVKGVSFGPCIWHGEQGVLNQHIYKIESKRNVDKYWLFETIKIITRKIEASAHGFKDSLVHVRKKDITSQKIPVPPYAEQIVISKKTKELSGLSEIHSRKLQSLIILKKGLMQDLLTGRVRVKGAA